MSLPPNYGADYIRDFEKMYRELAAQYKVTLIPFLLSDIARQLKAHPELMGPDGIHPTPAGNKVVADTVMRVLEPMLR
jgi:acyl-CoA thioesterase-1